MKMSPILNDFQSDPVNRRVKFRDRSRIARPRRERLRKREALVKIYRL
jgi:hypothetical protein